MPVHHSDSDGHSLGGQPTNNRGEHSATASHGSGDGSHAPTTGCNTGFLLQLAGSYRFTSGKAANGLAPAGHATNPFKLALSGTAVTFGRAGANLVLKTARDTC